MYMCFFQDLGFVLVSLSDIEDIFNISCLITTIHRNSILSGTKSLGLVVHGQ